MPTGFGQIDALISAPDLGDAYGDAAGDTAVATRYGADFAVVYADLDIGQATSVTVEVAVTPDAGVNYYSVHERALTATGRYRFPVEFVPGETILRIRGKAAPDDVVTAESCTIVSNDVAHTFANIPVRPSTITVTVTHAGGTAVLVDDGEGALTLDSGDAITAMVATIDYETGALVIGGTEAISAADADYRYDLQVVLTSSLRFSNLKYPIEG